MISPADYASILCSLDKANELLPDISNELVNMQHNLSETNTTDDRISALQNVIQVVSGQNALYQASPLSSLISAVGRLQQHVTRYYGDLNTFLANNSIQVSSYIAAISKQAGYTINPSNIGSSCA